jgi:sulfite reductase (NADPH) flavoprotein alpha-component
LPAGTIRARPGLDAVELFKKMASGEVKAVWIIGTNPVASMPNRSRVIAGLERAELVVVQDAFHPTETSCYADILLPGALWAEAEGTMVNSERNITLMQSALPPPGDAQADWEILAQAARHFGFGENFNYKNASDVFDEIRRSWNPKTGYDLRGISYERLQRQSCQWPCAPGEKNGKAIRYLNPEKNFAKPEIYFPTSSGRAQFFARPFLPPAELPDAEFPFALTTGRVAHQWHTLSKTGKISTLNKLNPGAFVEIHPEDATALGVENGGLIRVQSRRGFAVYPAQITPRVRAGDCFVPFHWNDLFGENLAVNAATSEAVDAISLQPEFKFSAVALSAVRVELPDDFTPEQKKFLDLFLTGISGSNARSPAIPATAPFTASQREHINQMLARLRETENGATI